MKHIIRIPRTLALLAGALLLSTQLSSAANVPWSGGAGDKLWGNTGNWGTGAKPTTLDDVVFGNLDTTTATSGPAGVSNSIVDASFTSAIKSLRVTNTSGFHNIRLTNNLAISGSTAVDSLFVGSGLASSTQTVYATISGPAALTLTNASGNFRVVQGTNAAGGAHTGKATLDLSGLDTFSARVAGWYVATSADGTESAKWNRPCAAVSLAKTNYITATTHLISESFNNNGIQSQEKFGQVNYFNIDSFNIGERKGLALVNFNTGWSSPTVQFRNTAGTGRSTWSFGSNDGATGSTGATGNMDVSAGTVDALVGTLYLGESESYADSSDSGDGNGFLTMSAGTIDVNTAYVGYQHGDGVYGGQSTGKGTLTVRTNGLFKVNNDLWLTRQLPPYTAGTLDQCGATLVINAGTVTVAGNVVDGGGTNSITITNNGVLNLQPAGDLTPGTVSVKTLNLGEGALTNWSTLTTTTVTLRAPATEFAVYPGQTLVPVAAGVAGTLQVNGSLRLTNATLKYDLGDTSTYDQIAVTGNLVLQGVNSLDINPIGTLTDSGTYTLLTYGGTLVGDASNLALPAWLLGSRYSPAIDTTTTSGQVNLTLTGTAPTLTWSGGVNGNAWDVNNTVNFNFNPEGGTNTEKFYNLDKINFDNTSTNPSVSLVGTLFPGAITVSSDYSFSGSGKISGGGQLTLNGGTLNLLTTNDFLGNTILNGGTLQVGNGTTADGGLSGSSIQNYSALIFNPAATQNVAGALSGYGTLTKQGPGVTVLRGANSFSSDLTIAGGTVIAGSTTALGDASGKTTVATGATFDINGVNFSPETFSVSGAGVGGKGAVVNNGADQGDALALITMTGDTTFGGSGGRMDINNVSGTPGGLVSSPAGFKLTKVGVNALSLFNNYGLTAGATKLFNNQIGEIEVKEGVLRVQCGTVLGDPTKTITVRSNATFQLDNLWAANIVNKVVVLDDGACMFATRSAAYDNFSGPITLNGTNIFDSLTGAYLILSGEISGTGSLVKGIGYHPGAPEGASTGTGILILSGSNSFTGDFKLQTGTTILTNSASVTKAANIVMSSGSILTVLRPDATLALASGQAFKGVGTLNGKLNSPANTTVSPGTSTTAALINLKGDTTLRGTTIMDLTKTNATLAADKLAVTGTLDLGGALTVSLASNTNLAAGNKFTLFTATTAFVNAFSATNLPVLPAGLAWSNSIVSTSWNIEVIATEPAERPVLTNTVTGNQLALAWSTAYSSYVLQGQTNPTTVGLLTNSAAWGLVPGVSGNQVTLPIDPANGSVFFRLLHQ